MKCPFDVAQLAKGDRLTPSDLELVVELPRTHKKYALEITKLAHAIEKAWLKERQERVTIACRGDAICILTDEEAVLENKRRRQNHQRGLVRTQKRQAGIDASKLTAGARKLHERECVVGAAFLLGGRTAVKATKPRAHRRATPRVLLPRTPVP